MVFVVFSFLVALKTIPQTAQAQSSDDQQRLNDLTNQIQDLTNKLNDTRSQEKTLNSQLQFIDGQTQLTELKIQQTNYQIALLSSQINDLSGRITRLSGTVDNLTNVLLTRIVSTYKEGNYSMLDLIFSSHGFSDLLERMKYIEVAQANDKKVLYELQATKSTFNDQKTDKQTRQQQQQQLETQLTAYQSQLDEQKKAKSELLRVTKNNEAVYQSQLQAALAEQPTIEGILAGAGTEVDKGHVSKGTTIGYAISGASACSSGTHLHFEVHQGGLQDPSNYLSSHSFSYSDQATETSPGADEGTINPHGNLDWPIDDPVIITQGYGMTPYAKLGFYGGGPHTGIDMYSPSSLEVKANHDGELFQGGIACGGGTLHYFKIDDGDGVSLYFLHTI